MKFGIPRKKMGCVCRVFASVAACIAVLAYDTETAIGQELDDNIVLSALKYSQSVSDTPSLVSVTTRDNLQKLGALSVFDALTSSASFVPTTFYGGRLEDTLNHGIATAVLLLRDGVDVSESVGAHALMGVGHFPVEMIDKIETIDGPGGILWGANALFGVVSIKTITGDTHKGLITSVMGGGGAGRPYSFRAYAIYGDRFWNGKASFLVHANFQTWRYGSSRQPFLTVLRDGSPPNPPGAATLINGYNAQPPQSYASNISANLRFGPLTVRYSGPLLLDPKDGTTIPGGLLRTDLGEDSIDCTDPSNHDVCNLRVSPDRLGRYGHVFTNMRVVSAVYDDDILSKLVHLTARASYLREDFASHKWPIIVPNLLLEPEGLGLSMEATGNRWAASLDTSMRLPIKSKLLIGSELSYEENSQLDFYNWWGQVEVLPFKCPPPDRFGRTCPVVGIDPTSRLIYGGFVAAENGYFDRIIVTGGLRWQGYEGTTKEDLFLLFSAGAVVKLWKSWFGKIGFNQGFRPPVLERAAFRADTALSWPPNPGLRPERSDAVQAQLYGPVWKPDTGGGIKSIGLSVSGGLFRLKDYITIQGGHYANVGTIGIQNFNSEFYVLLRDDSKLSFRHVFNRYVDTSRGSLRNAPNNVLQLTGYWNLWKRIAWLTSNLLVYGSAEDPNRYRARSSGQTYVGEVDQNGRPIQSPVYRAEVTDIVMDRISPLPIWNIGVETLLLKDKNLRVFAQLNNVLNARFWAYDEKYDLTAYENFAPIGQQQLFSFLMGAELKL